ncbi:MAG: type II toxin-antitoxin system prevent-host-death family antitoxin [Geodermatophilaceae bacterium]|nr:type II toxin-antitoxin system prevent-host-death family antitoxin [Geodermatophilaceae bacterium]
MSDIASRELRNNTADVLRRVEAGEVLVVTVDRRPVAALVPLGRRRRWVAADEVWARIGARHADRALSADLDDVLGQRIDEL